MLYEVITKNKITEFVVDHNYSPSAFSFEPYDCNIRITSYNVCYTKLLRFIPALVIASVSNRFINDEYLPVTYSFNENNTVY